MKAIVIGRHELTGEEGLEVIEQENVMFPVWVGECETIIRNLLERAKEAGAALVFQSPPFQASNALHNIIDDDVEYRAGGIVSMPGEHSLASCEIFHLNKIEDAGVLIDAVKFVNPNAIVEVGSSGLSVTVEVAVPMKFVFSHIDWIK